MIRLLPHLILLACITLTTAILILCESRAHGDDGDGCPSWVPIGICRLETRSYWDDDGSFHYVDRRDGLAGERGCCQMTFAAFKTIRHHGETFSRLRTDPAYAIRLALRYLAYLRDHTDSWDAAVAAYNTGLDGSPGRGARYLLAVQQAAGVQ